ncbi:VOC family protein [Candidatus Nitrosotenuis aquarius]|uniref:VOC family protein n=1 Tax=Candidatus Nitrosotenuis aquarius TaxID=1846278 RepID=UPI000C1E503F|nr:VOC family protein [Candidatus Nitrosotenuis aquarius]
MNIKRVGNVILAVKDLDKSTAFYHELLGLPIKNQRRTWVDLGQTGALLSLHPAAITSDHSSNSLEGGMVVGFLVGDLKSALDELKSRGVRVHRDIMDRDAGKNAIVLDPDGYMISLFEPKFADSQQQSKGYHGFAPA